MSRNALSYSAVITALLLSAVLSGCGSSNKEGSSAGGAAGPSSELFGNVARVGDTECFQCHSTAADPLTRETFIEQYQRSQHAKLGCESCHGGGAQHHGVGPFPFTLNREVSDDQVAARCAQCHNGVTQVDGKTAPLSSSPNFSNGNHANPFGAEEAHEPKCARCHSHEGSILYGIAGYTGDASIINNAAFQPVLARDPETFSTMNCETCHEHGGNVRQTNTRDLSGNVATWDPDGNKVIGQFDLCTSCHNMNTNAGKLIGSGAVLQVYTSAAAGSGFKNVSTAAFYHNTAWYRILPSTHVDQAASRTTASGTTIEGYVIRKNQKNPCFECHGHEFQANTRKFAPGASASVQARPHTTFTDWARSGHAGQLLQQKVAAAAANPQTGTRGTPEYTTSGVAQVNAVMNAGVTEASGPAWSHYNWDDTSSRGACQRCHTSTGASNFMKNPSGYDATGNGNDFAHLTGWRKAGGSGQQELLYCWGCHSNPGTGKLYTPGARTEVYAAVSNTNTGTTGSTVTVSYPDIAGSNVCMTCHVGREVGDNIKAITDENGVLGFVNSHYLTAGATLFAKSGYTFEGRNYTNPSFFKHDVIGTAAAAGTGTNGPCVGCHMTSPNKHTFTNVSTSGGVITKITTSICATCHTGLTAEQLTAEEEDYEAALSALAATLATKGIFFNPAKNPYFFTSSASTTNYTNWAGPYGVANFKNVMGSAFNLNALAHDPGGYAHNRFYAKRLIWDSIDYIDDGTLNNSVPATLTSVVSGQTLTDAQAYLGSTRP